MELNALQQWIADYDNGKQVESVIMGGMGRGYETAIQECAVEIMRILKDKKPPKTDKAFVANVNKAVDLTMEKIGYKYGFSGAQVGAAKNIASVYWRQSPKVGVDMMRDTDPSRVIHIWKEEDSLMIDNECDN